jgi:hypothetical protein
MKLRSHYDSEALRLPYSYKDALLRNNPYLLSPNSYHTQSISPIKNPSWPNDLFQPFQLLSKFVSALFSTYLTEHDIQ